MESLVGEERLLNILKDIIEISWVDQWFPHSFLAIAFFKAALLENKSEEK